MAEAINFNLDATDDPVLPDGIPSFDGGQFSNLRANLLQPNQSKLLGNCDIDKLGKLRTRRGSWQLEGDAVGGPQPSPGVVTRIQGLTSYQTPENNYVVAAHDMKIWEFDTTSEFSGTWKRIALGGVQNDAEMLIYRTGLINHLLPGPPIDNGYPAGTTVLDVDGLPAVANQALMFAAGEKLYFSNNLRSDWYEYTISNWATTGAGAGTITIEEPGLVFDVKDGWKFIVARPALIDNVGGYPGGYDNGGGPGYANHIVIDGYVGEVFHGESFVIKAENKRHVVDTVFPVGAANTTELRGNWTGSLQTDFLADNATVPVVFAQGNDKLYFSDGTGPIYAWDGDTLMNISTASTLDYLTGSSYHDERTTPPQDVSILLWFQNRLIASGIPSEPDAIYFSDYFDGTSWDRDYQKVRIGGGESDPITGLLAWTDYNLLVFKKNSIYIINLDPNQNPTPDDPTLLVASFSVKQLHKKIGCPAPNSAVQVGGGSSTPGSDVFFVDGDKKVHSIRRVMAAETQQEVGTAVSLPIQDILDTINLDTINTCAATYHNEHYVLGFPSTRGALGGTYPNATVAYNLLTQSWCGVWAWGPLCFAMRTDLGDYSKMIFGDKDGNVRQWLDDQSLDEETEETYKDIYGGVTHEILTQIVTRALTGGDFYSFKTGLSVEFEFDESMADEVIVQVVLDKVTQNQLIAWSPANPSGAFSSASEVPLRLPFTLPVTLPTAPDMLRKAFDLQRYGTWRELQFRITTTSGKLALRSIRVTFFMDTLRLHTLPDTGIFGSTGDIWIPGEPGP